MMLLNFMMYLVIGLVAIYATAFIHLFISIRKYGWLVLDFWQEVREKYLTDIPKIQYVVGLILWPYRLLGFITSMPDLYDMYESF